MRHAGGSALDELEPLLDALRRVEGLTEKKRGVFYRRSSAFLHFHDDLTGYYADVRIGDWERRRVTTRAEQRSLLSFVRRALA
jgi:hypothetical protein